MEEGFVYPRGFASKFDVARQVAQAIASGVWTPVQWDVQTFDLLDEMLIINPWTFTPKQAGYYFLYAQVRIINLTVPSRFQILFFLNGAAAIGGLDGETTNVNEDLSLTMSALVYLTPNDAVDVRVWQNNGIARNIQGNIRETRFFGYRVS